ncbi:MAG: hypothetical protein K8U57_07400 [Planctomycetes bacterium]|nr:hypothetical protein [Planctomycetota bacterium]
MAEPDYRYTKVMAEILRIQRWAGGETPDAARIFGLLHGFESVCRQENESFGISEADQDKVEDMLEEVEAKTQSTDGMSIKDRLRDDGIDESVASCVMELCLLESRFTDGVNAVINGRGSVFSHLGARRSPEHDWRGALHYMELVDCTEGAGKPLHAVYAPAVPRVGEIVTPEKGSRMVVVAVEHVAATIGSREGRPQACLVPYIMLKVHDPADDE